MPDWLVRIVVFFDNGVHGQLFELGSTAAVKRNEI
jgi:hypothetical protein